MVQYSPSLQKIACSVKEMFRNKIATANLLGSLCTPRTDPNEAHWRNSGDVAGNVPHGGGRVICIRTQIDRGQAVQEVSCAALGHPRVAVYDHVFAHTHRVRLVAQHRQSDSRIAPNVPDFLVHRHVADYELLAFDYDPHDGDLRAAVRIERRQMGE